MTKQETDLTADPRLADWLKRGADHIKANTCPNCGSKALAQVDKTVRCCNCNHEWQVNNAG